MPNTDTRIRAVRARDAHELNTDNWMRRRRFMYIALAFIYLNLIYLIGWAPSDGLHENMAIGYIAAFVGIIGSYVFGAVWDDRNRRSFLADTMDQPGSDTEEGGAPPPEEGPTE